MSETVGGEDQADLSTEIIGSWTLSKIISADGTEQTLEEYCAAQGVDASGMQATYTFNEGGSATADIGGIGTELTYEVSENTVTYTVTSTGATATMTYDGDSLSYTDESTGMTSVCTKN